MVGTGETPLVVVRGNSASGKSTVAAELRNRFGPGLALVEQDQLRRVVLRERDRPGGANIGLIDTVARYAGYHVVEGILYTSHYGAMLRRLAQDHRGRSHHYYLDIPFAETLRRHAGKPQRDEYGEARMRTWYRTRDLLPGGVETVIGAGSTLAATVDLIMRDTGLADPPAAEESADR